MFLYLHIIYATWSLREAFVKTPTNNKNGLTLICRYIFDFFLKNINT